MSSCLSLELEMVKSSPSDNTPSPSSIISESNSPPQAISTRRPRTSRKRPNQTYDEAEALLSTAYPNIFSSKKIKTQTFGTKSPLTDYDEASQLLLPFDSIEKIDSLFNPTIQMTPDLFFKHRVVNFDDSDVNQIGIFEDFDAESILDEEIEEGIDSFMGIIESNDGRSEAGFSARNCHNIGRLGEIMMNPFGFGSAGKFQLRFGLRGALRENDVEDWWKYSTVEFEQISPRIQTAAAYDGKSSVVDISKDEKIDNTAGDKKRNKKKKKKVAPVMAEAKSSEEPREQRVSPLLKLDYDGVLAAWSDKEYPFSDDILGSDVAGIDLHKIRLGEIDLFGESGMREACVLRYKEKRRNRLFSKNIRYQVRKLNADQRPRIKGRFVKWPNATNLSGLRL